MGCVNTVVHSATIHRSAAACPAGPRAPEHTPPAAVDAERTLLGALLLDGGNLIADIIDLLPPGPNQWFYDKAHHYIYDAITTLFQRRDPIDLVSVTDVLRLRGHLDKVGGSRYLAELLEIVVTTVNTVYYARLVREKAMLRSLIDISTELSAQAYDQEDGLQAIIAKAQGDLGQVAQAQTTGGFTDLSQLMNATIHAVDEPETLQPNITTGFHSTLAILLATK